MTDIYYYAAQSIGFIAILISFYAMTLKDDKAMMNGSILCCIILVPHFIMLGSMVSAASVAFIGIRVWVAKNYPSNKLMYLFLILGFFQAWVMIENWQQIFSILSVLVATVIYFKLKGFWMRLALVVTCIFWVIDSIIIGSYPSLILNSFGALIHASTAYRIYTEGKKLTYLQID
jgi:hypothetical protein